MNYTLQQAFQNVADNAAERARASRFETYRGSVRIVNAVLSAFYRQCADVFVETPEKHTGHAHIAAEYE